MNFRTLSVGASRMHRLRKVVGLERLDKHATCSVIVHCVCLQGFVRSCLMCTLRVVKDWLFVSSDCGANLFGKGVMSC